MCLSRSGSEQRLAAERERTLCYDSKATPTVHFTPRQQHITSRGESGGKDKSGESDLADLLAPDEVSARRR